MSKTRLNKSFSRRIGKSLSPLKTSFLEKNLHNVMLNAEKYHSIPHTKVILEIGFGMGEHFVHNALLHPNDLYIGCESYINGVANVLKHIEENNIQNILIWNDNVDIILFGDGRVEENILPTNFLDCVFILFPDPWPKNGQKKRRLINIERIQKIKSLLKPGGIVEVGTDIQDYASQIMNVFTECGFVNTSHRAPSEPHLSYIQTKYHKKALAEGRVPTFFSFMLEGDC